MNTLSQIRGGLVKRVFASTADENYIVERWCFRNGLLRDFYWPSVHSVEKYLKTVLPMNESSAQKIWE